LDDLAVPIVGAPMAGDPGTPELAAAVCMAGGLGFLAAGYKSSEAVREDIAALRALTTRPFGVNLFYAVRDTVDDAAISRYRESLRVEEERYGVSSGEARWTDDGWAEKLRLMQELRPAVVSFTFGCPEREVVDSLRERDIAVWATVTSRAEAEIALGAGVDALVAQGGEAGGHQGSFRQHDDDPLPVLFLTELVALLADQPVIAAGGIATSSAIRAVLAVGARAAQIGSAFMLSPEAGTSEPHRRALRAGGATRLTRAFTGRRARGIVNRFMAEHESLAPAAYPEIHYLTAPLRAAARERRDGEGLNLWAGQAHAFAREAPAGEIVERWAEELRRR
jgi:nitronate monooxygenase